MLGECDGVRSLFRVKLRRVGRDGILFADYDNVRYEFSREILGSSCRSQVRNE